MWRSAKRDLFDMFVSGIHSCHSFLEFQASTPYCTGSTLHPLCIIASCPSLRCSCRKELVSCREAEGLVTEELWSPRFVTIQWWFFQLCYVKNHKKLVSCREAEGLVTELSSPNNTVIVSKIWIIYRILIVFSFATQDFSKPINNCRDWAFSNSGLEMGLPAFQLPMFAKCDALPKRGLCDMFV